ncbi:hypothetical protein [Lacticaseibacillus porcinae]|uniref:hypothetical protein n=1 Tax=Lacticaseibacillus porcinae TaxID=1123687 RepID=UPI000F76DF4B|nr:hypothetical protein [Lacticaseibacillus porcinae]
MNEHDLELADLIPERIYQHEKRVPNTITALMRVKSGYRSTPTSGGFRPSTVEDDRTKTAFLVLTSGDSKNKADAWQDHIEDDTLTYFGDNKSNTELLSTNGNKRLFHIFKGDTDPYPILFMRMLGDRRVEFSGLCFPVSNGLTIVNNGTIPNYKAKFYIDQQSIVTKRWLLELKDGIGVNSVLSPISWQTYMTGGSEMVAALINGVY